MVSLPLHCPFCENNDVGKNGTANGKQRYLCRNTQCSHKTFYADYIYNGCKPDVKKNIIKMCINGNGIRATSRCLGVSCVTVLSELKKKNRR